MENLPLLLDQSITNLSIPKRYIAYANAYLNSSEALCERMVCFESQENWPNASVVLMTAAHATELFLKGMIIAKTPQANLKIHNINVLAIEYKKLYSESEFSWDVPFETEFLGYQSSEIDTLIKKQSPPSIRYRYPVEND